MQAVAVSSDARMPTKPLITARFHREVCRDRCKEMEPSRLRPRTAASPPQSPPRAPRRNSRRPGDRSNTGLATVAIGGAATAEAVAPEATTVAAAPDLMSASGQEE